MNLYLKQATVYDSGSQHHLKSCDLIIEKGTIAAIGANLKNTNGYPEIAAEGFGISAGWFDTSVSFGEPGYEDRETIANGLDVAAASGFTGVALQPNTHPVMDQAATVNLVRTRAEGKLTRLFPIGALTLESQGKDLAELYEMREHGAIAFGDYGKYLENANLLKIALQYTRDFDGLLLAFSQENTLRGNGIAHEGVVATRLGLKGIPALAEELAITRNLQLLEYTGGRLHIPTISTAGGVQLIREAKAKKGNVTCSVAVHNLVLTDEALNGFDTRHKVSPPLRSEEHRKALLKGVKDGTIDAITTDHNPLDIELKKMEFDLSKSGTIGLENAFGSLMTVLPTEKIVEGLTAGWELFGIGKPTVAEGQTANLTLFSTAGTGTFQKSDIKSKSKNSAFLGTKTKGSVIGTICGNQSSIR